MSQKFPFPNTDWSFMNQKEFGNGKLAIPNGLDKWQSTMKALSFPSENVPTNSVAKGTESFLIPGELLLTRKLEYVDLAEYYSVGELQRNFRVGAELELKTKLDARMRNSDKKTHKPISIYDNHETPDMSGYTDMDLVATQIIPFGCMFTNPVPSTQVGRLAGHAANYKGILTHTTTVKGLVLGFFDYSKNPTGLSSGNYLFLMIKPICANDAAPLTDKNGTILNSLFDSLPAAEKTASSIIDLVFCSSPTYSPPVCFHDDSHYQQPRKQTSKFNRYYKTFPDPSRPDYFILKVAPVYCLGQAITGFEGRQSDYYENGSKMPILHEKFLKTDYSFGTFMFNMEYVSPS